MGPDAVGPGPPIPKRAQALIAPGYDFGRCFFLLLVRLLRNLEALQSKLPPAALVNQKKSPAGAGRKTGAFSRAAFHQPVGGAGHTVFRKRVAAATAGGDEVEVGGEGNGGRHALGLGRKLGAHGQEPSRMPRMIQTVVIKD